MRGGAPLTPPLKGCARLPVANRYNHHLVAEEAPGAVFVAPPFSLLSLFFVVFGVMEKSNFAVSCFLEVRRVRI